MRALAGKWCVAGFALLLLSVLPSSARADSFTLDGFEIDGFSLNTSSHSFSVQLDADDALQALLLSLAGSAHVELPVLTVDDFSMIGGSPTLVGSFVFDGDTVSSDAWSGGFFSPLRFDATISYESYTDPGPAVPEPSTLALLLVGLIALAGMAGLRHRSNSLN